MNLAKGSQSWITFAAGLLLVSGILLILFHEHSRMFLLFFLLCCIIEGFFLLFFRDPKRDIGSGVVAVADGIIRKIDTIHDEDVGESLFISTFMNVYHVHVNRIPLSGTIQKIMHIPGSHLPAFTKESDRNERMVTIIKTEYGPVKIIQIAGTVARRIYHYGTSGQQVKKGDRMGIIKLGSRVDLIIPKQMISSVHVKQGDGVRAGTTSLCSRI